VEHCALLHYPDFIAALARGRKRQQEIKPLVDRVYGDKTLSNSQINRIIRAVKDGKKNNANQQHSNAKKTRRTNDFVASVATTVEEDRQATVCRCATKHGLTHSNVYLILI
jgi:hypothetical protein